MTRQRWKTERENHKLRINLSELAARALKQRTKKEGDEGKRAEPTDTKYDRTFGP